MKSEYRNAVRSKELIKEAIIKLLDEKKDISLISISDIVNTAKINRGTFYNHYNNIMEVVEEMEEELVTNLSERFTDNAAKKDLAGFMKVLVSYFKENEATYRKLIKGLTKPVFDNLKTKFIMQLNCLQKNIDEFTLTFIVNGLAGIYLDYLENRINFSLDELAARATNLLNTVLS